MKAAVVDEVGQAPKWRAFDEPVPTADEVALDVVASALTNFTRIRASGGHYSFSQQPPFGVGIDGIGYREDGSRCYFLFPRAPFGAIAERTVVPAAQCLAVPDSVDDVALAAVTDPALSAWAALQERAKLVSGETVLVHGATGSAGRVAVQVARYLGAGRVVVTGRNRNVLAQLVELGADDVIPLDDDGLAQDGAFTAEFDRGIDVVLDYLWGPGAQQILMASSAGDSTRTVRFVQIGTSAAPTVPLRGQLLRAAPLLLMGSGIGTVSVDRIMSIMQQVITAAGTVGRGLSVQAVPMSEVERIWTADVSERIVFRSTR